MPLIFSHDTHYSFFTELLTSVVMTTPYLPLLSGIIFDVILTLRKCNTLNLEHVKLGQCYDWTQPLIITSCLKNGCVRLFQDSIQIYFIDQLF